MRLSGQARPPAARGKQPAKSRRTLSAVGIFLASSALCIISAWLGGTILSSSPCSSRIGQLSESVL